MSTNHIIGASVNENENTVAITVNGVELAVISLRFLGNGKFDGLRSQKVEYKSSNYGPYFHGSLSLSSEKVVWEYMPESVVRTLASISGMELLGER